MVMVKVGDIGKNSDGRSDPWQTILLWTNNMGKWSVAQSDILTLLVKPPPPEPQGGPCIYYQNKRGEPCTLHQLLQNVNFEGVSPLNLALTHLPLLRRSASHNYIHPDILWPTDRKWNQAGHVYRWQTHTGWDWASGTPTHPDPWARPLTPPWYHVLLGSHRFP